MTTTYSEAPKEHIPPSLEKLLLNEFDTNSYKPEKKTIMDRLCKYLCCFSLMNDKKIL
tara:strand:- start:5104 stop:5277 length:174 start_codon:yes stop_codon:yes gene_type:complete